MFRVEIVKKLLGVALLIAGASCGVMGIAWSQVVFSVCAFGINTHYTKRFLGFGAIPQLFEAASSIFAAALVGGAIHAISGTWDAPPILQFLVLGSAGAAGYVAIIAVARIDALADVMVLFRYLRPEQSP